MKRFIPLMILLSGCGVHPGSSLSQEKLILPPSAELIDWDSISILSTWESANGNLRFSLDSSAIPGSTAIDFVCQYLEGPVVHTHALFSPGYGDRVHGLFVIESGASDCHLSETMGYWLNEDTGKMDLYSIRADGIWANAIDITPTN